MTPNEKETWNILHKKYKNWNHNHPDRRMDFNQYIHYMEGLVVNGFQLWKENNKIIILRTE